jgi:cyclohexanone monooxygenase
MALDVRDLLSNDPVVLGFDPVALKRRYDHERDRRLRPEGTGQYARLDEKLGLAKRDPYTPLIEREAVEGETEAVIIGAGFAALLAGAYLYKAGITDVRIIDVAGDFGGTWYWNRYPNAQCDTESYIYLPLLEDVGYVPERNYSYASEIFAHARALGRRFELYDGALFQTEVTGAVFDEAAGRWQITTDRGDQISARHLIMANGSIAQPKLPDIEGIDQFEGHIFHTSRWDYDYTGGDACGNLTGLADKQVGIVGTGATAVQCVVPVANSARQLFVFQRTPSAIGVRGNKLTDPDWAASLEPGWQRRRSENFTAAVEGAEVPDAFPGDGWIDLMAANRKAVRELRAGGCDLSPDDLARVTANCDYVKMEQIRTRIDTLVTDSDTAELLKPWYRPLCKRPCFHDEYLETFNRSNVQLVDASKGGVERLTKNGAVVDGREYPLDCLIFATGFDVGPDVARRVGFDVVGRGGMTLAQKWSDGFRTQFGVTSAGFPNCFFLIRTQTPNPQNVPTLLEGMAEHVAYLIATARDRGGDVIESTHAGEEIWQQEMDAKRRNSARFYSECTPGYFNNEGDTSSSNFYSRIYGGGTIRYFDLMRGWREAGELKGMALSNVAADIASPLASIG